jgi:hypothetical protein
VTLPYPKYSLHFIKKYLIKGKSGDKFLSILRQDRYIRRLVVPPLPGFQRSCFCFWAKKIPCNSCWGFFIKTKFGWLIKSVR